MSEEVEIPMGRDLIRGTLTTPVGGAETGVVLVAGAGSADRSTLLPLAREFARHGVSALTYDKRLRDYTAVHRDYDSLADDAVAAVDTLRGISGATRVGAVGVSEGSGVVALASTRTDQPFDFLILVSPAGCTPLEQVSWAADATMSDGPVWIRRIVATALASGRALIDYLDEDPVAVLRESSAPVFALWGADDASVPVNAAYRRIRSLASDRFASLVVEGAAHDLVPARRKWVVTVREWMDRPHAAAVQGVEPRSAHGVPEPPTLGWHADPRVHAAVSLLAAIGVGVVAGRRSRFASRDGI